MLYSLYFGKALLTNCCLWLILQNNNGEEIFSVVLHEFCEGIVDLLLSIVDIVEQQWGGNLAGQG